MAGSNEGNEGNEGNAGNAGLGRSGGFSVLPDRVDLPFVTVGRIADRRLPGARWREADWAGDKAAMLTLVDFAQLSPAPLLYAQPAPPTITVTTGSEGMGGSVTDTSVQPVYWQLGTYALTCIAAPKNGPYMFALKNPQGNLLQRFSIGAAPVAISRGGIAFTLNAGDPAFEKGDTFNITLSIGATELWVEPPFAFRARLPARVSVNPGDNNSGDGRCKADQALPGALSGDYVLECTSLNGDDATFMLSAPNGATVSTYILKNSKDNTLAIANQVQCSLTVGPKPFAQKDFFTLGVAPRTDRLLITRKLGGDVGTGTCKANLRVGTYKLRCTKAATVLGNAFATGARFRVVDPDGNPVQGSPFTLSAGSATSSCTTDTEPFVTIRDGDPTQSSTLFVVGDGFNIVVKDDSPDVVVNTPPDQTAQKGECTPIGPFIGTYLLRCTKAATVSAGAFVTGAEFSLFSPEGAVQGSTLTLSDDGGGKYSYTSKSPPGFTITDGNPTQPERLFEAGDGFDLDVGGFVNMELDDLVRAAEDERADALGEIVAQNEGFIGYFLAAMTISPKSHPRTCLLLQIGSIIGSYVVMHFKGLYQRARPSQIAPALLPPVPVPGHPSYPSGHSTQAHLMALCALEGMPTDAAEQFRPVLMALADRIARNREIAGLHYPSDSAAGANLAEQLFAILNSDAMPETLPPGDAPTRRRFQRIAEDAKDEWR